MKDILAVRQEMPRIGTRKLHYLLRDRLPVGRDKLFEILSEENLLIRRRKRGIKTTNSRHWMRKYDDRTKSLVLKRPEQLWVADITYMSTEDETIYLHLVTDAYSKQIMGYKLSKDLMAESTQKALEMAFRNRIYPDMKLMHHSDRGLQYCSAGYVQSLRDHHCQISMTQDGSPYDNAIAERVNGILKDEFYCDEIFASFEQAQYYVDQAVSIYNKRRPHLSCSMLTPVEMHRQHKLVVKRWNKEPLPNMRRGSK
jgi:transposase InsO family protein